MSIYQTINCYKRYIPFLGNEVAEHGYYAFGHFDALDILPVQHSLKGLWENYIQHDKSIRINHGGQDRQFSSQPIFIARDELWRIDDDFADIEICNEYPFIFIALLNKYVIPSSDQMSIAADLISGKKFVRNNKVKEQWVEWANRICDDIKLESKIKSKSNAEANPDDVEGKRESGVKEERDYKFACYYPLNISQAVLRIHAHNYLSIVNLLAKLQRKYAEIQYSYTISGLNYHYIHEEAGTKIDDEMINDVSFDIVVNQPENFSKLVSELDDILVKKQEGISGLNYRKSEVIGSTDVRLTYLDVKVKDLLRAYRDIINPKKDNYRLGASSFISNWSGEMADIKKFSTFGPKEEPKPLGEPDCSCLKNERALYKLLDTANMLNKSEYMHYINAIIKPAIVVLIKNINEFNKRASGISDKQIKEFNEDTSAFLQYCQDLLSSTLRADRQFFEAPGFNTIMDETPVKLIAAYHSCLYEIRHALKEDNSDSKGREYSFLGYPKMTEEIVSGTLFLSQDIKSRLYCIALPWDDVFNIRRMIPHLVHEVGHNVANSARDRESRFYHLVGFISRLLVSAIFPPQSQSFTSEYEKEIIKNVKKLTKPTIETEEMYYSHRLKDTLKKAVAAVLIDNDFHNNLWVKYIQREDFRKVTETSGGFLNRKQWKDLEYYEQISKDNRISLLNSFGLNSGRIVEFAITLARECYADIITVIALKMDEEQYLLTFYDAGIIQNAFEDAALLYRANIIRRIMRNAKIWSVKDVGNRKALTFDEKDFLCRFERRLSNDPDKAMVASLESTIDIYLSECLDSLSKQFAKRSVLLTKDFYHKAFHGEMGNGVIPILQQLLWSISREV